MSEFSTQPQCPGAYLQCSARACARSSAEVDGLCSRILRIYYGMPHEIVEVTNCKNIGNLLPFTMHPCGGNCRRTLLLFVPLAERMNTLRFRQIFMTFTPEWLGLVLSFFVQSWAVWLGTRSKARARKSACPCI